MRIDVNTFADAIVAMADGKSAVQTKSLMKDVVQLLHEERAIGLWRKLERAIERSFARRYGAATITVLSAHPLSKPAREAIDAQANGAEVIDVVDDRLIGGAIVRKDNTRIDGSVTGALMRLKSAMYTEV